MHRYNRPLATWWIAAVPVLAPLVFLLALSAIVLLLTLRIGSGRFWLGFIVATWLATWLLGVAVILSLPKRSPVRPGASTGVRRIAGLLLTGEFGVPLLVLALPTAVFIPAEPAEGAALIVASFQAASDKLSLALGLGFVAWLVACGFWLRLYQQQ